MTENKIVKKLVNSHCLCYQCEHIEYCKFGNGANSSIDCCACPADEYANGIHAAYRHLAGMPHEQAIEEIIEFTKQKKEDSCKIFHKK